MRGGGLPACGFERQPLRAEPAELREVHEVGELEAVAEGAGGGRDGIGERERAEADGRRGALGWRSRVSPLRYSGVLGPVPGPRKTGVEAVILSEAKDPGLDAGPPLSPLDLLRAQDRSLAARDDERLLDARDDAAEARAEAAAHFRLGRELGGHAAGSTTFASAANIGIGPQA